LPKYLEPALIEQKSKYGCSYYFNSFRNCKFGSDASYHKDRKGE